MRSIFKKETCPILLLGYLANSSETAKADVECKGSECAWWIDSVYTTEGLLDRNGRCAVKFIAEKNSEGKLPV